MTKEQITSLIEVARHAEVLTQAMDAAEVKGTADFSAVKQAQQHLDQALINCYGTKALGDSQ